MAKDKSIEESRKIERERRIKLRKEKRMNKYIKHIEKQKRIADGECPICGEHPYCYCGDGTPYSY